MNSIHIFQIILLHTSSKSYVNLSRQSTYQYLSRFSFCSREQWEKYKACNHCQLTTIVWPLWPKDMISLTMIIMVIGFQLCSANLESSSLSANVTVSKPIIWLYVDWVSTLKQPCDLYSMKVIRIKPNCYSKTISSYPKLYIITCLQINQ